MAKPLKADVENRANFQAYVVVKFPKATLNDLFSWFKTDENGAYRHVEIQEMWTGWNMHREFLAGFQDHPADTSSEVQK